MLLTLFMLAMILPVSVEIAGVRLTPIRVILLLSFIPLVLQLISGRKLRVIATDALLAFFCIWMVLSLLKTEGTDRFAFSVVSGIEVMGGYLLGRFLIRNTADFRLLVRLHLIVMAILFPFALVEFTTGQQFWARILDQVGDVVYRGASSRPRMGFDRVLAGFEHPILFGVFCSMAFGTLLYIWRDKFFRTFLGLGFVTFMTFMSLSAGAVISLMLQLLFAIWDWIMKGRWKLLVALGAALFVFLEIASNRGAVIIFIETLTFNQSTAWTRVAQWEFAGAEVLRNPIFGKGFDPNWIRPAWLHTPSIDSYWLVIAFRHGFPAIIALGLGIALAARLILKARDLPPETARIRTGYMIVLVGVSFSMATVHLWDASVVYFYFFLGAGLWIADAGGSAELEAETDKPQEYRPAGIRYSRFAPRPIRAETPAQLGRDGRRT